MLRTVLGDARGKDQTLVLTALADGCGDSWSDAWEVLNSLAEDGLVSQSGFMTIVSTLTATRGADPRQALQVPIAAPNAFRSIEASPVARRARRCCTHSSLRTAQKPSLLSSVWRLNAKRARSINHALRSELSPRNRRLKKR